MTRNERASMLLGDALRQAVIDNPDHTVGPIADDRAQA